MRAKQRPHTFSIGYYEDYKPTLVDTLIIKQQDIESILEADAQQDFLSPMACNSLEAIHYELCIMLGYYNHEEFLYNDAWITYSLNNQDNIPF